MRELNDPAVSAAPHDFRNENTERFLDLLNTIGWSSENDYVRSVALTGCKAGCGVSTLVVEIGKAAADAGVNVLLVDCAGRGQSIQNRFRVQGQPGIAESLNDPTSSSDNIYESKIPGLSIMPFGKMARAFSRHRHSFAEVLATSTAAFDLVLFDMPVPTRSQPNLKWYAEFDCVLLVATLGETRTAQAKAIHARLSHVGARLGGVILNKNGH